MEGLQESRGCDPRWQDLPWTPIKIVQHPEAPPLPSVSAHSPGALSSAGQGRGLVEGLTSGGPLPTGRARRRDRRGICAGTAESPGPSGSGEGRLWRRLSGKS